MKKIISLVFFYTVFCLGIFAQEHAELRKKRPIIISVMNSGTLLPGGPFISTPIHIGASAGTEWQYNRSDRNQLFQTAKLAITYHKYVQTAVQLYSEAGYRRSIWRGTAAELRLGVGYLHSFTETEIFKLKDGVYQKKARTGRPQFMGSTAFGVSYRLPKESFPMRIFCDYQFSLQMPYVKQYVTQLPTTAVHLGVAIPCFKTRKNEK